METLYSWLIVKSNSDSNNVVAIACKTDVLAERFIEKLENFTDFKVFNIDFYGNGTLKEIKEKYAYTNGNLHIHSNNISLRNVYDLIYNNIVIYKAGITS